SAATAALVGLHDRGVLAPGYRADINVVDFDGLTIRAPEMVYDLPAGGRRLVQRADGYRATYVAGELVSRDGTLTGAPAGAPVRLPSRSASTAPYERRRHDRCGGEPTAYVDLDRGAGFGVGGHERERDAAPEHRREVPTRHLPHGEPVDEHCASLAWDLASF